MSQCVIATFYSAAASATFTFSAFLGVRFNKAADPDMPLMSTIGVDARQKAHQDVTSYSTNGVVRIKGHCVEIISDSSCNMRGRPPKRPCSGNDIYICLSMTDNGSQVNLYSAAAIIQMPEPSTSPTTDEVLTFILTF